MSHNCSSIMEELDQLLIEREIFDWGDQPAGGSNPRTAAWRRLQQRISDAQSRLRACMAHPPIAPPPPVPVRISVAGLQCFDQNDGPGFWPFDTEDDEPYVLVWALAVPSVLVSVNPPRLTANPPRVKIVKIGPWDDVDDNQQFFAAPVNSIWNASSGLIKNPSDVILIASLLENDNSDPQAVTAVVEAQMFAHLITNLPRLLISRTDFVSGMVDGMSRSVGFATTPLGSGGVIDADDRIDLAKELRITQGDLDRVFAGSTRRLALDYRGNANDGEVGDYRVFFDIRRA